MSKFSDILRTHIKPIKYHLYDANNNTNKHIGKYKINRHNIVFLPTSEVSVEDTVRAVIEISNTYTTPTFVNFNGIDIKISYPTELNDMVVQHIIDVYNRKFENLHKFDKRVRS